MDSSFLDSDGSNSHQFAPNLGDDSNPGGESGEGIEFGNPYSFTADSNSNPFIVPPMEDMGMGEEEGGGVKRKLSEENGELNTDAQVLLKMNGDGGELLGDNLGGREGDGPSPNKKPLLDVRKLLPDLEKLWTAVENDINDFTAWTQLLQYVDSENELLAAREAYDAFLGKYPYCYGYWKKYADYEKRKGSAEECAKCV